MGDSKHWWCRSALGLFASLVGLGCTGVTGSTGTPPPRAPETPAPKSAAEPPAAPAPAEHPATDAPTLSDTALESPEPAGAPRSAKVAEECSALCESAAESCSRRSARQCRANCGKYESLATRCEAQVLGAIRCQATRPKLVCSNLASDCVQQFRELDACEQGTPITKDSPTSTERSGWQRIEDAEAGIAIDLPTGAELGEVKGHRAWTATAPAGTRFLVTRLPAVLGRPTEKALMEATIHYLGHKCQPAVRLHGRFDTERDVAERFDGRCQNGDRWHGLLRASREQLVLIAEIVPPGKTPVGGAGFFYSFEYLAQ